jgi:hypothetical protein
MGSEFCLEVEAQQNACEVFAKMPQRKHSPQESDDMAGMLEIGNIRGRRKRYLFLIKIKTKLDLPNYPLF